MLTGDYYSAEYSKQEFFFILGMTFINLSGREVESDKKNLAKKIKMISSSVEGNIEGNSSFFNYHGQKTVSNKLIKEIIGWDKSERLSKTWNDVDSAAISREEKERYIEKLLIRLSGD